MHVAWQLDHGRTSSGHVSSMCAHTPTQPSAPTLTSLNPTRHNLNAWGVIGLRGGHLCHTPDRQRGAPPPLTLPHAYTLTLTSNSTPHLSSILGRRVLLAKSRTMRATASRSDTCGGGGRAPDRHKSDGHPSTRKMGNMLSLCLSSSQTPIPSIHPSRQTGGQTDRQTDRRSCQQVLDGLRPPARLCIPQSDMHLSLPACQTCGKT